MSRELRYTENCRSARSNCVHTSISMMERAPLNSFLKAPLTNRWLRSEAEFRAVPASPRSESRTCPAFERLVLIFQTFDHRSCLKKKKLSKLDPPSVVPSLTSASSFTRVPLFRSSLASRSEFWQPPYTSLLIHYHLPSLSLYFWSKINIYSFEINRFRLRSEIHCQCWKSTMWCALCEL